MNDDQQSFITTLLSRFSTGAKHLGDPAPSDETLTLAARTALRAPCHTETFPVRFLGISASRREELAQLFEKAARHNGANEERAAKARRKAYNGAALVGLIVKTTAATDAQERETLISAGAALMNFLNTLHSLGFGGKVVSGEAIDDELIQQTFCAHDERLLAWIVLGTQDNVSSKEENRPAPLSFWGQ